MKSKFILVLAITAAAATANAAILDKTYDAQVDAAANSNADATTFSSNDRQINYRNKNLANYQDPYLTNPRAYQSNQYGDAALPPKANVFFSGTAPVYNAYEARQIEEQAIEPASGQPIDAQEY